MTTKKTVTSKFSQSPAQLHAALTDAAFWNKLANRFSAAEGSVEKFESTDAGTTVVIRQAAAADKLPSQASKFVKGDVSVTRTFTISPLVGDSATATVTTETSGVPVKFNATQKLAAAGDGSEVTTDAEFAINVPLVGSMLEGKVAPYLDQVVEKEAAVLAEVAATK